MDMVEVLRKREVGSWPIELVVGPVSQGKRIGLLMEGVWAVSGKMGLVLLGSMGGLAYWTGPLYVCGLLSSSWGRLVQGRCSCGVENFQAQGKDKPATRKAFVK
ncbi:hypothetical protein Droror1_Dr00026743 [Drosera rotundifolia]